MHFFSRTSDIISRSLTDILIGEANPLQAITQVESEIEQGVAGVRRCVQTAQANEQRLLTELEEYQKQSVQWGHSARSSLAAGHEDDARTALRRRHEMDDLIAGLRQEHVSAVATREQLTTTLRAVEARLAEARRLRQQIEEGSIPQATAATQNSAYNGDNWDQSRAADVEAELAAMRQELDQSR